MTEPMPDFNEMVARYHKRIAQCKRIYDRDGRLVAEYGRRPSYRKLLARGTTSRYQVTDFDGSTPTGHREYDHLYVKGNPMDSALHEFSGEFRLLDPCINME